MSKFKNKTPIDISGERAFLYREENEDISRYQERIEESITQGLERNKDSFKNSLGYLTSNETLRLFEITPQDDEINTSVSFDGVFLIINEEKIHLDEIKFLKDLKAKLIEKNFDVSDIIYNKNEHQYLQTKNVLKFTSDRERLYLDTNRSQKVDLNENFVSNVYDYEGNFASNQAGTKLLALNRNNENAEQWFVDNEINVLYKEIPKESRIGYSYKDFPLVIEWSDFVYYSFNDENFDYKIKSLALVESSDTEETPYLLTQEGAKLIDELNKISMTYWGK